VYIYLTTKWLEKIYDDGLDYSVNKNVLSNPISILSSMCAGPQESVCNIR